MDQENQPKTQAIEENLVAQLKEKHFTITTVESCTGGLLAGTIVNAKGASDVFNEGYITYSNEAKERLVHVSSQTLEKYGAVSSNTAREMAEGAAKVAKAQVALSTTGIAGPGGGTEDKPVGLVYIACTVLGKTEILKNIFTGSRQEVREQSVAKALDLALQMIR